jgi:hypothetical protein
MKAVFNIKTKVLTITGKEILPFQTTIECDHSDYWDSVTAKKTGEPLYDINIFCDDMVGTGVYDDTNPLNYSAQFVGLVLQDGFITTGSDYQTLPLKVTTGEFNPKGATFFVYSKDGNVLFKTKKMKKMSEFHVIHKVTIPNMTIVAIDEFGFKKIILDKFGDMN